MRWLCLVPLQARRRVWVHTPADSCLPRWLEGGSAVDPLSAVGPVLAVDPVSQGRRISRAPRIFPAQALAGREAWLQTASLLAAGPDSNSHRKFNPCRQGADRFYRQLRAERL